VSLKKLRLIDIVLMNVVVVTSLRWISSAGAHGFGSLLLWVLAALCFFIPQGYAVTLLSSRYPGEGGLYRWTELAMGPGHGFLCGWCYWVNNLLYFPGLLMFVAGNIAVLFQAQYPDWYREHEGDFILFFTLGLLWFIAGFGVLGVRAGKWLQNIGGFANWIPAIVIAVLGIGSFALLGSANPINPRLSAPGNPWERFSLFAQMCFAFSGLELVSFFQQDIEEARATIRRGIAISGVLITMAYLLGTLGILFAVPNEKINSMNGLLMAIHHSSANFHLEWISPLCAFLIALGGTGAAYAWFSGSAKIPYLVGVNRYLPSSFQKLHPRFNTPVTAIVWQTVIATLLTLFATSGAQTRMETTYRILVDMCLLLYFIPYLYLFLSAHLLRARASGWHVVQTTILLSGFLATLLAILTSLCPPDSFRDLTIPGKTALGTATMIAVGLILYWRGRSKSLTMT